MDDADREKKVMGSIKEAIGKVTGHAPLQSEGAAEQKAAEQSALDKAAGRKDARAAR